MVIRLRLFWDRGADGGETSGKRSRRFSRSLYRSEVAAYRRAGSLARHRSITHWRGAGAATPDAAGGFAVSVRIAASVSAVVARWNVFLPLSISPKTRPSENWSE